MTELRAVPPEGIAPRAVTLAEAPKGWKLRATDDGYIVGGPAMETGVDAARDQGPVAAGRQGCRVQDRRGRRRREGFALDRTAQRRLGTRTARAGFDPTVTVQHLTSPGDPAVGRSDHADFHERGWAAVAVSEDLFSTPTARPGPAPGSTTPPGDTLLDENHDTGFAATIARSVTATALTFAGL